MANTHIYLEAVSTSATSR